jgi:hypothetical protein
MKDCNQQAPLNIEDTVSIGVKDGKLVLATLKDIFGDQVLVSLTSQHEELVLVHRKNIARIDFGLLTH